MATVYRFKVYDITTDEFKMSRRWATTQAIQIAGGEVVGEGAYVDEHHLGRDISGMTDMDFDPAEGRQER